MHTSFSRDQYGTFTPSQDFLSVPPTCLSPLQMCMCVRGGPCHSAFKMDPDWSAICKWRMIPVDIRASVLAGFGIKLRPERHQLAAILVIILWLMLHLLCTVKSQTGDTTVNMKHWLLCIHGCENVRLKGCCNNKALLFFMCKTWTD